MSSIPPPFCGWPGQRNNSTRGCRVWLAVKPVRQWLLSSSKTTLFPYRQPACCCRVMIWDQYYGGIGVARALPRVRAQSCSSCHFACTIQTVFWAGPESGESALLCLIHPFLGSATWKRFPVAERNRHAGRGLQAVLGSV